MRNEANTRPTAPVSQEAREAQRNVYRLQLSGERLCEALRKIVRGEGDPREIAQAALNHKAADPDWASFETAREQVIRKDEAEQCAVSVEDSGGFLMELIGPDVGPFTREDRAIEYARKHYAAAIRARHADTEIGGK